MKAMLKPLVAAVALCAAAHASAQITFYDSEGFRGRTFATNGVVDDFNRIGFNDRASSVVVTSGRWEVCDDARFGGRCVVLKPGSYDSLRGLGMENRISSVRPIDERPQYLNEAPPPLPQPTYEYRRRPEERLIQVPVTSVHAVVGPPEQRCWVERQQVSQPDRRDYNVPGAVIGGVLGGILGHQIGGGTGKTVATIGGAVGGGAIGANVGRNDSVTSTRDVRRCSNAPSGPPQYWDVTYNYRGVEHTAQLSAPPGRTILVNRDGEPRM